jgi:hypothetical protein
MSPRKRRDAEYEGIVFAYELTRTHLRLRLFRRLTLGRVPLSSVLYVRQRGAEDLRRLLRDMFAEPFRSWYWPHPLMSRDGARSTPYVLRTERGARVYLRLRPGYHYRLRAAVGEARAPAPELEPQGEGAGGAPVEDSARE